MLLLGFIHFNLFLSDSYFGTLTVYVYDTVILGIERTQFQSQRMYMCTVDLSSP